MESNDRRQKKSKIDFLEIFNKFRKDGNFTSVGKILGKGSFGEVREIIYKNKTMAGKIVMQDNKEKSGEYIAYDLKGKNIIKINKIVQKEIDDQYYYLIIMEKAVLRDLGKLTEFYHNHNLLKLLYKPFDEDTGNNLLRFYARQILNALELLYRSHFVHFDLKPENLLISINLIIKLSDFSLLKKIEDKDKIKIPGGTSGYVSLEYYKKDEKISGEDARKQDFFFIWSNIIFFKIRKKYVKI
jgi:serine/threonine protein kinase